ncbi:MAG: 50S ribosomal protein L18 [Desulfonatronovibrionaceae bacterium]
MNKKDQRLKRKVRIRKKISGTPDCPRLVVFRSNRYISAQVVDDTTGHTLTSFSSASLDGEVKLTCENAKKVGMEVARLVQEKEVSSVVFDRNGYYYHGRVKALADGAREAGLKF